MEIVNKRYSIAEFQDYVEYQDLKDYSTPIPTAVYLHHTVVPTPESWRGERTMLAMKRYYERQVWINAQGEEVPGWMAGPHIFVAPDGIWEFTNLYDEGVGVKGVDEWRARHVEMVGFYDSAPPSDTIMEYTLAALSTLLYKYGIKVIDLKFHRDALGATKTCPGTAVQKGWLLPLVRDAVCCYTMGEAPAPDRSFYVVQPGDYLSSIAEKVYGDSRRWGELAAKNGLVTPYPIYPGQKLQT